MLYLNSKRFSRCAVSFFSRTLLLRVLVGAGVIGNHIVLPSATPQNLPDEVAHKMYGEEELHMSAL